MKIHRLVLGLALALVAASSHATIILDSQSRQVFSYYETIPTPYGLTQGATDSLSGGLQYSAPDFSNVSIDIGGGGASYYSALTTTATGAQFNITLYGGHSRTSGNLYVQSSWNTSVNSIGFTVDQPFLVSNFPTTFNQPGHGQSTLTNAAGTISYTSFGSPLPAGSYIITESSVYGVGDPNNWGANFIFLNTSITTNVPEPSSLLLIPVAGLLMRRRKKN